MIYFLAVLVILALWGLYRGYLHWDKWVLTYIWPRRLRPRHALHDEPYVPCSYTEESSWALQREQHRPLALFFVHPTLPSKERFWNMTIDKTRRHKGLQGHVLLWQLCAFRESCDCYVPLYRQASLYAFYPEAGTNGDKALERAYQDVKRAFHHFIAHQRQGRPFVLAGHSQGSCHAERLWREEIRGTELEDAMKAAFLVGSRVATNYNHPHIYAWNTFLEGGHPLRRFLVSPVYREAGYEREPSPFLCKLPPPDDGECFTAYTPVTGAVHGIQTAAIRDGLWFIKRPKNPTLFQYRIAGGWLHIYDFQYPWQSIRNVLAEIVKESATEKVAPVSDKEDSIWQSKI